MSPPFLMSSSPASDQFLYVTVLLQPPVQSGETLPNTARGPTRVRPALLTISLPVALSRWNELPNRAPYGSPTRASVFTYQVPPRTMVLTFSPVGDTYSSSTMLLLFAQLKVVVHYRPLRSCTGMAVMPSSKPVLLICPALMFLELKPVVGET